MNHMHFFMACVLGIGISVATNIGRANTGDEKARQAFALGTKAYGDLEFAEALLHFKNAYKLRPTYKILYNIAQTQLELHRPHLAFNAFEQYMLEGRSNIDAKRREEIITEIRKLRKVVGEILVVGKTGTECRIDDEHIGFLPLGKPVRLGEGVHKVTIHLHGEVICKKEVEVVAGKKRIEQCKDRRDAKEGPEPESAWDVMSNTTLGEYDIGMTSEINDEKPSHFWKVSPWVFSGLAGVTMTVGTILAMKTSSLNSELSGACDDGVCPLNRQDDVDRLPRLAVAADVMFIATSVLTATAITFFILKRKKERKESSTSHRIDLDEELTVHRLFTDGGGG